MLPDLHHYRNDPGYPSPALSSSHLDNSPFESNEYTYPASPNLPPTPSYNGSYQNSPYTTYSDLEIDNGMGLLDDISHEYDPSEYDAPGSASHSTLINFPDYMNSNTLPVSVSVTAPDVDPLNSYENNFDHGSPSSSNGIADAESDTHSRASSVSSQSHYLPSSPPMEVTHTLSSLKFDSPHWNPSHLPGDRASPPSHKPPSPPQLVIPETSSSNGDILHDRTPVINAPDGDGGLMNGPQLHIVPATPVSGGGVQTAPFMNNTLQGSSPPTWNTEATSQSNMYDRRVYPDHSGASQSSNLEHYLSPQPPRIRSKSDTVTRPTMPWEISPDPSSTHQGNRNGVNLNDILPSTSPQPGESRHTSSAGPYQSTYNSNPAPRSPMFNYHSYSGSSDFLSPDMALTAPSLRRARSDGGRAGHRHSRSEGGISYPPSAHADFIARNSSPGQFLHPTEPLPNITRGHHRRSSSGSRDRGIPGSSAVLGLQSAPGSARASPYPSPSASPALNYEQLPSIPSVPVSGLGRGRPLSLPPYGAAGLGVPQGGISSLNGMGGMSSMEQGMHDMNAGSSSISVSRQNVTTTATYEASVRRRKTEANFVCPVPNCGSTFTRHFNLKGHLRSHNEEKPYQCKWPGCGKGFARAHDCKRHEQLHFNYRPHKCEGCGKSFQRMDALNRHLKSEGGQDCQRAQEDPLSSGTINSAGLSSGSMTPGLDSAMSGFSTASAPAAFGGNVKPEPDNWGMGGVLM